MAIMRHAKQENNTGAVLTSSSLTDGRDYKSLIIERKFSAIDIGAEAGKTKHAQGCLVGSITSGVIYQIAGATIQEKTPQGQFSKYSTTVDGLQIKDKKSIYVTDATTGAIKDGSSLFVHVLIAPA